MREPQPHHPLIDPQQLMSDPQQLMSKLQQIMSELQQLMSQLQQLISGASPSSLWMDSKIMMRFLTLSTTTTGCHRNLISQLESCVSLNADLQGLTNLKVKPKYLILFSDLILPFRIDRTEDQYYYFPCSINNICNSVKNCKYNVNIKTPVNKPKRLEYVNISNIFVLGCLQLLPFCSFPS